MAEGLEPLIRLPRVGGWGRLILPIAPQSICSVRYSTTKLPRLIIRKFVEILSFNNSGKGICVVVIGRT